MTTLTSSLTANHRPTAAEFRRLVYAANGWNPMQRWDGRAATAALAGIEGPSQATGSWTAGSVVAGGDCDEGVHVIRYRYMDSTTGYVSNPSLEVEVTATSANGTFRLPINTSSAANMIRSTDGKVDKIIVEMTVVGGGEFFKAAEVLNSATTVDVSISDVELEQQFLAWDEDGHDPPPIAKYVVSHRERMWLFGQVDHSTGNADFTATSTTVGAGTTDPDWNGDVLGSSATARPDVVWLIQKDGDDRAYEIDYFDGTDLILKEAYAGSTSTDSSYRIFSRTNVIWVSRAGYPESFKPIESFIVAPQGKLAGDVTAGLGYGTSMIFFTSYGMFKLAWDTDPTVDAVQWSLGVLRGALNQRVVTEVDGVVYAMDRQGWTAFDGGAPRHISDPVDDVLSSIDFDLAERFHCVWLPETRAIRWHVVYTGDSYAKNYVQYYPESGAWQTGTYKQGISESALVPTADGLQVYLGDENGYTWLAETGTCDGCAADYSHPTLGNGATTTVLPLTWSTVPATNELAGCYAYVGGEYRLISSNTTTAVTLSSALTTAPVLGDTVWIGPIVSKLKTKAYAAPTGVSKVSRTRYLWLGFEPLPSSRSMDVDVYEDYSSTAKQWDTGRNDLDGVTWPAAATDPFQVDLSFAGGAVRLPAGSEYRRVFEVELRLIEPDADVEIFTLEHDGSETERLA